MDLGTGAYLRADTISWPLPLPLTLTPPLPPDLHIPLSGRWWLPWDARAESWVRSCCASCQPRASVAKAPGHQLCSIHLPNPKGLLLLPGSSLQCFFFVRSLIDRDFWALGQALLSRTPSPWFSQPKWPMWRSLVWSASYLVTVSWLFINWGIQVVLLYFSSCIIKICKQTIPASSKFLLQSSKVRFWIVTHIPC